MSSRLSLVAVLVCVLLLVPFAGTTAAQQQGLVYRVQYSVPFGVVSGRLMLLGPYLVFHDEGRPEASFVVMRSQIAALTVDDSVINIDTTGPIQDREGARTQFSFRLDEGTDTGPVAAWRGAGGDFVNAAVAVPAGENEMVYTAKHDHRFGSCRGQLIIRGNIIAYDSVDDLDHSRRWEPVDVKELKQKNPYQLSIDPFSGGTYNLELQGRGMDPADFKALVERITSARTGS